ncbi:MAG: hypothetical protein ACI9UV_002763, partial [Algoriphagus sp.]
RLLIRVKQTILNSELQKTSQTKHQNGII